MSDLDQQTGVASDLATVRTAIAGVGGYAGGELARLLLSHPRLQESPPLLLGRAADQSSSGTIPLEQLQPQLALGARRALPQVHPFSWNLVNEHQIDLVLLALPPESSREWVPAWITHGVRVIDLSGAWRLRERQNRDVYHLADHDAKAAAQLQAEAVYGCPELHRDEIAEARLVANPGCYATSIILALAPLLRVGLVDLGHGIVCDAKSGVSGAGKTPTEKTHFMNAADNLSAYAVFGHRHTGELLEQLVLRSDQIQFTPHLLPISRGILSTLYMRLTAPATRSAIESCFQSFYVRSPLVRVRSSLPQIANVVRTPYCDLGFELAEDGIRLVIVSCLDNLLKGAASQAVQNMNLMCGWGEEEGLL